MRRCLGNGLENLVQGFPSEEGLRAYDDLGHTQGQRTLGLISAGCAGVANIVSGWRSS